LSYGALGVCAGVSQRDERASGVIRTGARHSTAARRRASGNLEIIELVREVENQLFGLLAPNARHTLKCRDIPVANRANESIGAERRQQPEGERRSHALGAQHALKDATLERRREAEQLPRVFLDDEIRVQHDRLTRTRQRLIDAEWDQQLVGDAAGGRDVDAIELARDERPADLRDHTLVRIRDSA
jgi:hypothetical protein